MRYVLLSPIRVSWRLATFVIDRIGILLGLLLSAGLLLGGWFLTGTLIGAILGLPMLWAGTFLLLRTLY